VVNAIRPRGNFSFFLTILQLPNQQDQHPSSVIVVGYHEFLDNKIVFYSIVDYFHPRFIYFTPAFLKTEQFFSGINTLFLRLGAFISKLV